MMMSKSCPSFLDRIPRLAWQIGVKYNGKIDWGYIIFKYDAGLISDEQDGFEDGENIVTKRVFISPAKLATKPEFEGW